MKRKRDNGQLAREEASLKREDLPPADEEQSAAETLRLVAELLPVAVTRCGRDWRYLWANQAYADWLQCPLDEIVGRPIVDVIGQEAFDARLRHFERVLSGERVDYEEETNFRGIGKRWTSASYTPTLDVNGTANGWMAVIVDITKRKRAEEALRRSEERFRFATQAGKMFAYEWDAATDTLVRSGDCLSILGVTEKAHLTGEQVLTKVHPDDKERLLSALAELSPERPYLRSSYRMLRPDGSVIWVDRNSQAYFDERGKLLRVTGMVADITQRKLAEEALRESEERLQLAAQAGKMYAYEWDIATDVVKRSPEYLKILGLTEEEPTRHTRQQLVSQVHPDDRARFIAAAGEVTPENPHLDLTYRVLRPDGSVIWLKKSAHAFFNEQGTMLRMIGMVADVTDQKLAEEALSGVSGRLIQAQEQERVRIARELHDDIVQRLALLSVGLDQARQEVCESPEETRVLLGELQRQMIEISSDVQAVSRELHSSTLEHLGLTQAAKSWCVQFGERQRIEIDFSSSDVSGSPPYEISLCLFRVLQEAVHNANKHSQARRIEVRLWQDAGEIHLTVSDRGKGFDVASASQDCGLGLTSMRERVRLVNGTIVIDSKPMGGTTLHAWVPFRSGQTFHREAV